MTNFRNIIGILANGEACGSAQKRAAAIPKQAALFVC